MENNKILLVDDEPVAAMAEASRLENFGFEVLTLNSGSETIEYMQDNDDIQLILLDIELKEELDGIEIAQIIHKDKDIPILFLTAHEDPEFLNRAKQTASYNYLLKDTSGQMLANAIHQALKLHQAQKKIKEQNKHLQRKEEQYRKIVQTSRDAMVIIQNSKLYFYNYAFMRLTNCSEDELSEKSIDQIPLLKNIDKELELIKSNQEQTEKEFTFETSLQESKRYFKARLIRLEIQMDPAYFLTLYDMTEQKELLSKVEKARKMSTDFGDYIPICANCKKIKDKNKNNEPWVEPEIYISERLPDVHFTHGICPSCMDKLYPEFSIDSSDENDKQSD